MELWWFRCVSLSAVRNPLHGRRKHEWGDKNILEANLLIFGTTARVESFNKITYWANWWMACSGICKDSSDSWLYCKAWKNEFTRKNAEKLIIWRNSKARFQKYVVKGCALLTRNILAATLRYRCRQIFTWTLIDRSSPTLLQSYGDVAKYCSWKIPYWSNPFSFFNNVQC